MTFRRLVLVGWLTLVWCLLWADAHPGTVLAGLAVAVAVSLLVRSGNPGAGHVLRPLHALRFAVWFVGALVTSTLDVARTALAPRPALREAVVAVPIHGATPLVTTVVANAITLTPGTLTLAARPADGEGGTGLLHVHVLCLTSPEELHREVAELEALVVRAIGPRHAVDRLAHPLPPVARAPHAAAEPEVR